MKVEFADCELGIGVGLYVAGSEFLKADKSKDEYCSLAAATNAFYNLHDVDYYIDQRDYDTVKQWVKASGAVIFTIASDRFGHRNWFEIYVSVDNRYSKIIWSDDSSSFYTKAPSEIQKAKSAVKVRKGGKKGQ